ncbi:Na+/H+ antiporter subunit E [Pontibacter korlensis]|uniref:Monovalent cation/H+ antiporter subunit E n=1 Tax=Pontibacter korlensis TaxID=400092 RepID=A0A0E3ZIE0_9BACT|nr:Na+/H+ antiporter subunit E [Pontibacter korlensis]AKD04598.1 monovalent cation/H+ antiporter subunit E [Pontibacter korlensis]
MRLLLIHSILAGLITYTFFQRADVGIEYNALTTLILFSLLMSLLWISSYFYHRSYFFKLPKLISFILYFWKELLLANLKIAHDIVTPRYRLQPTVFALPLEVTTDLEISILANIIGLTPGTLSIDVSEDRKLLYVHTLYLKHNDIEQLKQHIKLGFEKKILELTA